MLNEYCNASTKIVLQRKMEIFTNPLYRNVLLEIVKHVHPSSIGKVCGVNKLTWKMSKEDPVLHEIVVDKQSDLFIDVYERKYYAYNRLSSHGDYVEKGALGFSVRAYLPSVIKCVEQLYNSILIECIRQTRNMEMVLNLRKRCILNGAKFLEDVCPKTRTYIPKNCVLAMHSIIQGQVDMLTYFVNLAENDEGPDELEDDQDDDDLDRPGHQFDITSPPQLEVEEIVGQPGYYRETKYNFVLKLLSDETCVALGVSIGSSAQRNLTRKEKQIALSMGLACAQDDSDMDEDDDKMEPDHTNNRKNNLKQRKPQPTYKFNSASTTDFINVRGFRCLLRARQKLEPTVFKSMLDIFLLHPNFKCDKTTIGVALSEHNFDLFDILRSKCDLDSCKFNELIQTSAFSHSILSSIHVEIPVVFVEQVGGNVLTFFVSLSKLVQFSPIQFNRCSRIQIPFPVASKNVKALLDGINMLSDRSLHYGACKNLQDLTDFRRLLEFFQITLTMLNESDPNLSIPSE